MFVQDPNAALLAQIAGAGEGNDFADRFLEGEHIVALNVIEFKDTQDHGRIVSVDFLVIESSVPGYAGKTAGEGFFISKSDKEGGKASKQRVFALAKAAVQSLGGNADDPNPSQYPGITLGQALVQSTLSEMLQATAPWRGLMLRASGRKKTGKNSKKEYVAVKYAPIPQTVPQIQAARARIEAANAAAAAAAPAQPVVPAGQSAMTQVAAPPPVQQVQQPGMMAQPMIAGYAPALGGTPQPAFQQAPAQTAPVAPAGAPMAGFPSLLGK